MALPHLRFEGLRLRFDVLVLRHEPRGTAVPRRELEDGRGPIAVRDGARRGVETELVDFPQRNHRHAIERLDRPLRSGVEAPDRLDDVADELDAHRIRVSGGNRSTTPPRTQYLAMFVDRILR